MNPKKGNRHWKEKKSSLENTILEEKTKRQISKTILEEEIIFRRGYLKKKKSSLEKTILRYLFVQNLFVQSSSSKNRTRIRNIFLNILFYIIFFK